MLVFISFSFTTTVNAAFKKYPEDGMWIDEFENTDSIDGDPVNCYVDTANKTVELQQGSPIINYNTEKHPDNVEAWYHDRTVVPEGLIGEILASFVNPSTIPGEPFEEQDKSLIGELDGDYYETEAIKFMPGSDYKLRPMHHFQFKITQNVDNIKKVTLKWWYGEYYGDANLEDIYIYVWRYGEILEYWGEQSKIDYTPSTVGLGDPNLQFSITDGKFISGDGYMDILIVGIPKSAEYYSYLRTDKVEATVETDYGYLDDGYIISTEIEPSNFGGWERVFWDSTKASSSNSITVQVLDKNKNPIEGYSSKTSPLDISGLKTTTPIRLKATFKSGSIDITPKLYNWGVMWQKTDGYRDSFDYDYRLDEKLGVKLVDNKVKVSEFYSDWEIFGKESSNKRSYEGQAFIEKPEEFYWYTELNLVGGGFRAPIVSEGKVYVASADNRIYAFDTSVTKAGTEQDPVDNSTASYVVDSSLGISDGYVIVPTCDTKNKENKIYALNSSNLENVKWDYSHGGSICYSSAPTTDNGRIFISSWSGKIWETPLFSFLNKLFSGNNKLIALDLKTGVPLWKPKKLPAGSFSSPAVGNGLVYVGCQNMWGSSLFAYDIETGENIWNASVGIIGKASPVYSNGKLFVLSREKKSITQSGQNKIVALNAETGEILWNKTIGDKPPAAAILNLFRPLSYAKAISDDAPIASPALKDDTLFVSAPDGTFYAVDTADGDVKWSSNITVGLINAGFYTASPVIVGDYVYVVNGFSNLYAFSVENEGNDVVPEWTVTVPSPEEFLIGGTIPDVIASPVISDGLIIMSTNENRSALNGRICCLGDYNKNKQGTIISSSIHVPPGFWWEEFDTDKINTTNNTVIFSVLDENNEVLTNKNGQKYENLNGSHNNLIDLTSNVIRLKAEFTIRNETEDLALDSWNVTWVSENAEPEFDNDSFDPGNDGWINQNIKECSIEVSDKECNGVISGLDVSSAMFRIKYIKQEESDITTSDWTTAICKPNISGIGTTRIYANFSGFKILELKNITFKIKDLAGNENTTKKTFKMDGIKPASTIVNIGDFEDIYNDELIISAEAGDSGGSGVDTVALKYRYRETEEDEWSEWIKYQDSDSPYSWYFGKDLISGNPMKSGYYHLTTVAKDNASNEEEIDTDEIISILFDMTKPSLENDFDEDYKTRNIPTFELQISDDYMLESLSFKPDFETQWEKIKTGINQKTYTCKWEFPEEFWDQISEGQGHYIYFKIEDYCGNIKETTAQNTLYLVKDETVAEFHVDLTSFKEWHWDDQFTVTANVPDDIDVENITLYYCYSEDNNNWDEWKQYGEKLTSSPYTWAFTASDGSGYYKFKTEITDTQGAVYMSPVETINVTLFPTMLFIILIILMFFSILISLLVISKMKKKHQ
jgi:outer membrane protein assembly factor BamB